jgi:hypothetical protein
MVPKPHRVLIGRVAGYADEAAAYLRRRRTTREPFARVWWPGDRGAAFDAGSEAGRTLFLAASRLIEVAAGE